MEQESENLFEEPKQKVYQPDQFQKDLIQRYTSQNPPQYMLALAPPGAGKSSTIAYIVATILNQKKHQNFIVLTFTRKTKNDLWKKLNLLSQTPNSIIPTQLKQLMPKVKTFNSLAINLLRDKSIISQQKQKNFFDSMAKEFTYDLNQWQAKTVAKVARKKIHKMLIDGLNQKDFQTEIDNMKNNQKGETDNKIIQIVIKYFDWLQDMWKQKQITFDFSIIKCRQPIQFDTTSWMATTKLDLLIVDEFQDTNPAQLKMLEAIIQRNKKDGIKMKMLCVGDLDQNIFTFRGSSIGTIDSFCQNQNHKFQRFFLANSHRLSQPVAQLARKLIQNIPQYQPIRKKYYKNFKLNALNTKFVRKPIIRKFHSEYSEVRWVVDTIYDLVYKQKLPYQEITILLRGFKNTNFYYKLKVQLQRRVDKYGNQPIPYQTKFGTDLFGRYTIKYIMAFFAYFYQKSKHKPVTLIIRKILQIQGIGKQDQLYKKMEQRSQIKRMDYQSNTSQKKIQAWKHFFEDFQKIEKKIKCKGDTTFGQVCHEIFKIINQSNWFKRKKDMNQQLLKQFVQAVQQFVDINESRQPIFSVVQQLLQSSQFDKQFALKMELDGFTSGKKVQIQTIHAAKGLQYRAVFLCALNYAYTQADYQEDQIDFGLPQAERQRMQERNKQIEDEKKSQEGRLIYTALTRTQGFSFITSSQNDNYKPFMYQPPEHPQFAFLRENAQDFQKIQFDKAIDTDVKTFYYQNREDKIEKKNQREGKVKIKKQTFSKQQYDQ